MQGAIDVKEGIFAVQTTTSQVGDPAANLTVFPNATLNLFNLNASPLNKMIVLQDGATVWNENGNSIVSGPVTLQGRVTFNAGNAGTTPMLTFTSPLNGPGSLVKVGPGPMILSAAFNEYTGTTTVSNGTLLVDGSYAEFAPFTVHGGTLGGAGVISGPVNVTAKGALAPGNLANALGTLTIFNTLTLAGTNRMDLQKSAGTLNSDAISGVTTLTLGGTLALNITGDPLAENDAFLLYSFTSASGAFAQIVPASPGPGLNWDTSQLTFSGTLRVTKAAQAGFSSITVSGTDVVFKGTNGVPEATYYILSNTNVAAPLMLWTPVLTNKFDLNGNFSASTPIDPNDPQRFYVLQLPLP
jgi:autotransporter-associated beta strand protein